VGGVIPSTTAWTGNEWTISQIDVLKASGIDTDSGIVRVTAVTNRAGVRDRDCIVGVS
jgi:hypothetical protein